MAILYGSSYLGVTSLNPKILRTYQTGQLSSVPAGTPTIHSFKPTAAQRTALRAATSSADAICVTIQSYFSNPQDVANNFFVYYHEPDNDGISPSDYCTEWIKLLLYVKPVVNAARTKTPKWGPIFTGTLMASSNAVIDTWVTGYTPDFVGSDPYANLNLITDTANYGAHKSLPWLIGEYGTSASSNSTDSQHLTHMKAGVAAWNAAVSQPLAVIWFDQYYNILDTFLTAGVTAGATGLTVNDLPGASGGTRSMPSGSSIKLPSGTADTVTTTSGTTGSSGSYFLPTGAIGHNHSNGAAIYLMPTAVAYWAALSTGSGGALVVPSATSSNTAAAGFTINITLPATINAGDSIFLFEAEQKTTPVITWPASFVDITPASSGRTNLQVSCAELVATGSEGGTSVTITSDQNSTKTAIAVVWPGTLVTPSASGGANGSASVNVVAPSEAIAGSHYGALSIGAMQSPGSRTWTPPAGYTEAAHNGANVANAAQMGVFFLDDTGTASTTGSLTQVASGTGNGWAAITLVIKPGINAGGPVAVAPIYADGTVVHQADLKFAIQPPSLYCYQNTPQAALVTGTTTLVSPFDTNVIDDDPAGSVHSTSTNPSRFKPLTQGYHQIWAEVTFTSGSTGTRLLDARLNAAGSAAGGTRVGLLVVPAVNGDTTTLIWTDLVYFNGSTDYLEIFARHSQGSNLALWGASTALSWTSATSLKARWAHP